MSGVFQNIDPPPPLPPGECVPAFGHTRWVERGVGVNILEDARHCSVLYICKYFVLLTLFGYAQVRAAVLLHGHADGQLQGEEALSRPPAPGGRRAHARGRAQGQLSPSLFYPVLRIRIRGSMPLSCGSGCGSGSFYFHHWPSTKKLI